MFSIRHPVRAWFGAGTVEKVREEAEFAGAKKALLFTDKGVMGVGIAEKAIAPLKSAGISVAVYDECVAEPAIGDLESAWERFRGESFDFIVGIGGGSSMDLAKSMSVPLHQRWRPAQTTSGPSSCPGPACPPSSSRRRAARAPRRRPTPSSPSPKKALRWPSSAPASYRTPPSWTPNSPSPRRPTSPAAAGVDALTHCLETYVARNATPLSELYSLRGMELIAGSLRRVCGDGNDIAARTDMALGSYYGGVALAGAGAGAIHALAYPLGSRFHIPHGVSNSLIFSHVMRMNYPANPEKFARIAEILGEDTGGLSGEEAAKLSVEAVERLCKDCGVPTRLSEVDVPAHVIPELAEAAFDTQQRLLGFNPKELTLEDIEKIYRAAA